MGAAFACLLAEIVVAQQGRPWVDPPRQAEPAPEMPPPETPPPAQPAPSVQPAPPTRPRRVDVPPPEPTAPARRPVEASPAPPAAPETHPRPDSPSPTPPPTRSSEPPRSRPGPEADPTVRDERPRGTDQAAAAQELAIAYLAYWSAPNAITLDATPEFYAPQVLFHGRQMSARALFEEKRRFVRRWPLRDYRPRLETMRVACDPAPPICNVRTAFDFIAESQDGKRSQGNAILQLGVSFASGEPMIVFETSQVTSRARGARSEAFEDDDD